MGILGSPVNPLPVSRDQEAGRGELGHVRVLLGGIPVLPSAWGCSPCVGTWERTAKLKIGAQSAL